MWRCGALAGVVVAVVAVVFAASARAAVTIVSQNSYVGRGDYEQPTQFGASQGGVPAYYPSSPLYVTTATTGTFRIQAPSFASSIEPPIPGYLTISGSGDSYTDTSFPIFSGNLLRRYYYYDTHFHVVFDVDAPTAYSGYQGSGKFSLTKSDNTAVPLGSGTLAPAEYTLDGVGSPYPGYQALQSFGAGLTLAVPEPAAASLALSCALASVCLGRQRARSRRRRPDPTRSFTTAAGEIPRPR